MASEYNLVIEQGRTLPLSVKWESGPIVYRPITGITNTAPVRITCVDHALPPDWRATVVSVKGMTELNAASAPPADDDYHIATVVDVDHVEFNAINAADYSPYVSGGYLQYNTPVDLVGYVARMKIKSKLGGTLLASTELSDAPLNTIQIVVDAANRSIDITMEEPATADIQWKKGAYDLEIVSPTNHVTTLLRGEVEVTWEITTPA